MAQGFAGSGLSIVSGALGVSTGGNTLGSTGTTFGTIVFAGIGEVTLSQSTAAGSLATITISAPVQSTQPGVTALGVSTLGNTSGNTGTTQGTVVLAGGNHITLSQATAAGSNATITISGENAIFGAGVSTGGNTSGTTGTVTGTLVLAGGNNVTLSQSTNASGATITISAASAAAGTVVSAIGVSTGGNTSGNTGTTQGTYVLAGGNNITLSQSTAAGSLATLTISGPPMFSAGVSTGGNTSGSTGVVSSQVVFAGGNNITLSQSTGGASNATITISGRDAIFGAGISTGGNTSGTSGTVTGTLVLAGIGEITLSQSTNASGATITISAPADTAATVVSGIGVSTGGNTSGNTGTTVGTVVFAGINNITLSQSTAAGSLATITISGPTMFAAGVSTGGNTSGSTGTVSSQLVLVGGNNVTLSQSTGGASNATVTISAANSATVVSGIGVSTGGNTSGNTGTTVGTVVFAGGNHVTLSQATAAGSLATITISGDNAIFGAGISTGGNTSGTSGTVTGTLVFAGIGEITLSQSTNASGATITISAPSDTSATVVSAIGVSTGGNTSGNTGTTIGTYVLAGGNNITLSQDTAAGSLATVTISGANAVFGAGVSTGGNTSGTTGTNTGTFVLVGGNNITLSQSTNASGNTVTISGPNGLAISAGTQSVSTGTVVFSNSNNVTFGMSNSSVITASVADTLKLFSHNADWISNFTIQNATLSLVKFSVPINITGTRMQVVMDLTGASNSTGAITLSAGVYTMSGSTASLSTSASRQISWTSGSATTVSSVYGGVSGTRYRTIAFNMSLTPGDYLMGLWAQTTNNGTWRIFGRQGMSLVGALDSNETNIFLDGVSTSSFTTAMPASINVTDTNYNRTGASALRSPGFIIAGTL